MDFFIVIAVYSLENNMTAITISRCIKEKASDTARTEIGG
jgi:hypothetical protein